MKRVVVTGGNGDIAQALITKLQSVGGFEVFAPGRADLDVTNPDDVRNFFCEVTPDILVNNAGYVVPVSAFGGDIESEIRAIDINLKGTFLCTMAVLEKNPDAFILNVGSSAATKIHPKWASYCAAKAAVVMATQCWAAEGVHAICLSPGRTQTKMRKTLVPVEDPDTLLKPNEYAEIAYKAIQGKYENGSHINVNVDNIKELLNG